MKQRKKMKIWIGMSIILFTAIFILLLNNGVYKSYAEENSTDVTTQENQPEKSDQLKGIEKEKQIENKKAPLEKEPITELNEAPENKSNVAPFSLLTPRFGTNVWDIENISILDQDGAYIKGKKPEKQKNVVYLKFLGENNLQSIKKNMTRDNVPIDDTMLSAPDDNLTGPRSELNFNSGSVVRIKNMGIYNGKPIQVAIRQNSKTGYPKIGRIGISEMPLHVYSKSINPFDVELWIEDDTGKEIVNPDMRLMMSHSYAYTNPSFPNYPLVLGLKGDFKDFMALDSSIPADRDLVQAVLTDSIDIYAFSPSKPVFNYLFNGHLSLKFTWSDANGTPKPSAILRGMKLFDPSLPILVPIEYNLPLVNDTKNDTSFEGKIDVEQELPEQNLRYYPDPLAVHIKVNKGELVDGKFKNIQVLDRVGNNISGELQMEDDGAGNLTVNIPKVVLDRLKTNKVSITATYDIKTSNRDNLMEAYNPTDGYFHIPYEATNSDVGSTNKNSGESLIKMPPPTAKPVAQTVALGSSTADLKPEELVTDLDSIFPADTVQVVGFAEEKTFSTEGPTTVSVIIKSEKTGMTNTIVVPVEVVAQLGFIKVPTTLDFMNTKISSGAKTIPRVDDNWEITIDNSIGTDWKVSAQATPVMDNIGNVYDNALIFKDKLGNKKDLANGEQLIELGSKTNKKPIIKWLSNEGVLFNFNPGVMKVGQYHSTIEWTLGATP